MADGNINFKQGLNLAPQSSDPSNPAEGDIFCSDGTPRAAGYWQYINSAWTEFGGGGSGGINYLEGDNNTAENGIGDWATYADAAAVNPVDGTGGSATITWTQNSTTPLRGDADFKFAKDAANRQGEGAGVAFTIDKADQTQKLTISFDYDASNANYADDDIRISVYDVTNANLIRINGEDLKGGQGTHYAQFQAASDSTSYRLIIHQSSTNATAYDIYFDNIKVGPGPQSGVNQEVVVEASRNAGGSYTSGDPIEFTSITEDTTSSWDGSAFTVPETGYYSLTGGVRSTTSTTWQFEIYVDGVSIDKVIGRTDTGSTIGYFSGVQKFSKGEVVTLRNNTSVTLNNDPTYHHIHIQKLGTSAEARAAVGSGREVTVTGSGNGGTSITSDVTNIDFTEVTDTTSSWDGSVFTAPETGTYALEGCIYYTTSTSSSPKLFVDNSFVKYIGIAYASNDAHPISGHVTLNKGQTLSIRVGGTLTLLNDASVHHLSITKLASPQTNLETATVAARYTSNTGTSIDADDIPYEDLVKDTHNAYNTTTGVYTVPISGYYSIHASLLTYVATWATSEYQSIRIVVDGVIKSASDNYGNGASSTLNPQTSAGLYLAKGSSVKISAISNDASSVMFSGAGAERYNTFSIARIK